MSADETDEKTWTLTFETLKTNFKLSSYISLSVARTGEPELEPRYHVLWCTEQAPTVKGRRAITSIHFGDVFQELVVLPDTCGVDPCTCYWEPPIGGLLDHGVDRVSSDARHTHPPSTKHVEVSVRLRLTDSDSES